MQLYGVWVIKSVMTANTDTHTHTQGVERVTSGVPETDEYLTEGFIVILLGLAFG